MLTIFYVGYFKKLLCVAIFQQFGVYFLINTFT